MQKTSEYLDVVGKRGFTVAEMLATISVLVSLFAIAVPQYLALRPERILNGAARNVVAQLMWARSLAVQRNNRTVATLPNNYALQILDDTNNNGAADVGEAIKTVNLQTDYPDVTIIKSGGDPDPVFYPRGITAGNTTYTVTNSSGSKTITVSATGNVTLN